MYSLYLYAEKEPRPNLPGKYAALEDADNSGSVELGDFESKDALQEELEAAAAAMQQAQGTLLALCASKYAEKVLPDTNALVLSPTSLQHLAACRMGLGYDYCPRHFRDSRRRNIMSFFILSFPGGHGALPVHFEASFLFTGQHAGQDFIITPDQDELEEYICQLAENNIPGPRIRIDYFSTGSLIWWQVCAPVIAALAQMGATLELRIHPAMLVAEEDSIHPLVSRVLRSKTWRARLTPPDAEA